MHRITVPVYTPYLNGNEKKYVNECLDTTWISSKGKFVGAFEQAFAQYIGSPYATSVANGTVALHLALLALGIGPDDEVIVPTFTYVASVNAITYVGAKPVFVDSLESTWQMNVEAVRQKITAKTRAIMAVHLYGQPCEMSALTAIAKENKLFLIEDCAEAFGSLYHSQRVGTFGDIATFSFFGNKTITTGEGGMLVMKDAAIYQRAANLKSQGISATVQYWHDTIGYNFRMTNICAAIGLAQLEQAEDILRRKRAIANYYLETLKNLPLQMHTEIAGTRHSYWMCSLLLTDATKRDLLRKYMLQAGIETRPLFYPVHTMPMYCDHVQSNEYFPIAESLGKRGMNLPSSPNLTTQQLDFIAQTINSFFAG
ncbi:DegT/DnrJ/EryC1/StrS aminotransferase family protein [soil metagenome]